MKARFVTALCALGSVAFPWHLAQAALAPNAVLDFGSGNSFFDLAGAGAVSITPGPDGGLILGATQTATGAHAGLPDGSENATIDDPWAFLGNTGMHSSIGPVTILGDDGAGNVTLDFTDWGLTWNLIAHLPLGGDPANFPADTGVATLTCGANCAQGDSFTLDYSAHVPLDDNQGFDGVTYELHLEGTVSAVPIPAAIWLFGSGLLGLIGIGRRKKS